MPVLRLSDDEARRLLALLDQVGWQASVGAAGFTPEDARTADQAQARLRRASSIVEPAARPSLAALAGGAGRARAPAPMTGRRRLPGLIRQSGGGPALAEDDRSDAAAAGP